MVHRLPQIVLYVEQFWRGQLLFYLDLMIRRAACAVTSKKALSRHPENKKARGSYALAGFFNNPGDFLLSHAVTRAVPSEVGLTYVFGMTTQPLFKTLDQYRFVNPFASNKN